MSPNWSSKQDWVASCHCFGQWSTVALFLFHCSQVLSKWKKPEGSLGFPDHTVSYLVDGLEQPQAPDEEWWLEHLEIQCWDERNIKFKVNFSGLWDLLNKSQTRLVMIWEKIFTFFALCSHVQMFIPWTFCSMLMTIHRAYGDFYCMGNFFPGRCQYCELYLSAHGC